jgi:RNA polymerase sigma factor (sigma-70 family)
VNTSPLVDDGLHLVHKVAGKLATKRVGEGDLISVCYFALCRAAETYDASRGRSWLSYAFFRIMCAALDERRREASRVARVDRGTAQAALILGDRGDILRDDEVTCRAHASEYLGAIAAAARAHTLSTHTADVTHGHEDAVIWSTAQQRLAHALDTLDPEVAAVVRRYFIDDATLRQIADERAVSYSSARRRVDDGLHALRRAFHQV